MLSPSGKYRQAVRTGLRAPGARVDPERRLEVVGAALIGGARVVTVFGSSRVEPASKEYEEARTLGRLLAERGFVVCNGGYCGTMEAAARGAKEASGRTIGCTVDGLISRQPNPWLDEVLGSGSLLQRLDHLTARADAFIVLGGGVGTLLELALIWNFAVLDWRHSIPIILVGECWQAALESLALAVRISRDDLSYLHIVDSPAAAISHLLERLLEPVAGQLG